LSQKPVPRFVHGDIWPDSTRSSLSPHPSVIIGNESSVRVAPAVLVGQGKGVVPMDDPNAPNTTRCAVLDGVSYYTNGWR
jgi:hypothetical protein